jgi:RNA polymerase sigma-70 factor (ECF subfamily)
MSDQTWATLPDEDLLRQVAEGNQTAFGLLYDRYHSKLYNYLLRLIFEEAAAQDILQETFLAVWQRANSFQNKSRVSTWLFGIAHHRAVDWLRSQKRLQRKFFDLDDLDFLQHYEPSAETWSSLNLDNEQIWQAMTHLTPDHRAVLELAFVYEMRQEEIAQVMGCPVGTVKSRVHHALKALSGYLMRQTDEK